VNRSTSRLRKLGSRAGSAMLEFALGSSILVTIFTATFQYGYEFYQYNVVFNAVNNGAHFAALQTYDSNTTTPSSAWIAAVKNMVLYGDPTGTSTTLIVKNLAVGNITITIGSVGSGTTFSPRSVTLAITGYSINAVTGSYTLTGKPAVTYPFQGMYCPDSGC
jgi:Flp pilus assembly protein TadG